MAQRMIVKVGNDVLRKKSKPVTEFNEKLHQLLDDMRDTMHAASGVGLAAPQVAILRRVCIVEVGEQYFEMINPEITRKEGECVEMEGCLSVPNGGKPVKRPMTVGIRAQDRNGKFYTAEGTGLLARAFCHEIDHLDGILYIDYE